MNPVGCGFALQPDAEQRHSPPKPQRTRCPACLRPPVACLCSWVRPTAHRTQVLILQHPMEVLHAKNTARLLHLSLARSQLWEGELFDESQLHAALQPSACTVLLYPASEQPQHHAPVGLAPDVLNRPDQLRLVVLDATWRKSRKMLHLNPLLQRLPRLSLDQLQTSAYLIRKAHKPGQLSTLEATCAALAQLEGSAAPFQPLLKAFDGFVAQHMAFRPQGG